MEKTNRKKVIIAVIFLVGVILLIILSLVLAQQELTYQQQLQAFKSTQWVLEARLENLQTLATYDPPSRLIQPGDFIIITVPAP